MEDLAKSLRELLTDHKTFDGDIVGKGFVWAGDGPTKQFLFTVNPDRFLSTESLDLGKDKVFSINGTPVLSADSLGDNVVKSNLEQLGRLTGLIVDGPVVLDQFVYFDNVNKKVGLGTSDPKGFITLEESGADLNLNPGRIGTSSGPLSIGTLSTTRILIDEKGNVSFGSPNEEPVQVIVNGKLAVGVANPDTDVDLHVAGAIKYEGRVHRYNNAPPTSGIHGVGDVIWNTQPREGSYVGWVCITSGNPGRWEPFGKIGNQ